LGSSLLDAITAAFALSTSSGDANSVGAGDVVLGSGGWLFFAAHSCSSCEIRVRKASSSELCCGESWVSAILEFGAGPALADGRCLEAGGLAAGLAACLAACLAAGAPGRGVTLIVPDAAEFGVSLVPILAILADCLVAAALARAAICAVSTEFSTELSSS